MIRKQEQKIKLLDKAYGQAQAAKEGESGASLDKVAKTLGGEQGAEFRKDIETPVSIFGFELWKSADEEEAVKVTKGYLEQAKAALADMKGSARGLVSDEEPQEEVTSTPDETPETVRVIAPNGEVGSIPAKNKDAALKAGYKLAD